VSVSLQAEVIGFIHTIARPKHRRQRLRVSQSVIVANLDQRRLWHPAVPDQFFTIGKRNHVVGSAVKDHSAWLHRLRRPEFLPGRTKKNEPRRADFHVRGADDHIRLVLVEPILGELDDLILSFVQLIAFPSSITPPA
jgi:hypothetical protein